MKKSVIKTTLITILLTGSLLRLLLLCNICKPDAVYPTLDEMNYREYASNVIDYKQYAIWSEGVFVQSTRAPVFPMLIGAFYILTGDRGICQIKLINIFSDILAIFLIFLVARRIFGIKTALATAALYAVFGHALYYMKGSNPHTFATMLLLAICLALLHLKNSYKTALPVFSILYALQIHTRPVFLVALPFLIPAIYLELMKDSKLPFLKQLTMDWKRRATKTILPVAIIAILCLPWGIRNYMVHKTIVPVCTIAGWHIASNPKFDIKLSIKYLTDNYYKPEHNNYNEADFFKLGEKIFFKSLVNNPLKIPLFGIVRILYCWTPPCKPFYRFLLPKAYVCPIYLTKNIMLPCPDFEGIIYISLLLIIILFIKAPSYAGKSMKKIFWKGRGIWIIILGYSAVHIIGIPLISYRFLIEPLLLIFATALGIQFIADQKHIFKHKKEIKNAFQSQTDSDKEPIVSALPEDKENCETGNSKHELIFLYILTAILLFLIVLPLLYTTSPKTFVYPELNNDKKHLTYKELRDIQWQHLGNIPPGTEATIQGVVKYIHKGFHYPTDNYYAEKKPVFSAARLFVLKQSKKFPLGTGDTRLNFPASMPLPKNGTPITISGKVKVGLFKEIIVDVEKYTPIPQR